MTTYRLTHSDGSTELVDADYVRDEKRHLTLYGTAFVIGRPREVVVRRRSRGVLVEEADGPAPARPSWAP